MTLAALSLSRQVGFLTCCQSESGGLKISASGTRVFSCKLSERSLWSQLDRDACRGEGGGRMSGGKSLARDPTCRAAGRRDRIGMAWGGREVRGRGECRTLSCLKTFQKYFAKSPARSLSQIARCPGPGQGPAGHLKTRPSALYTSPRAV